MKTILLTLIFLIFLMPSVKAQQELFISENNNPALQSNLATPIVTSQLVWSQSVNDEFKIYISLPELYDPLREEGYPVVYFLDGSGGSFHTITEELMQAQFIPEVITIGIGYPGSTQRNRDYTYNFIYFYQFLKQELIPLMDEELHTDPMHRTLFGHSYGGICVLFSMFQYLDYNDILFQNIISASPSIWWPDGQLAYTREKNLYENTHILPVNLYMTVGSYEGSMVTDLEKMQQVLERRNYEYFNPLYLINEGKDHSTNKAETFREGLRWVFRQQIQIPTSSDMVAQNKIGTSIYPNPATDQINIVLPPDMNSQKITCSILDRLGKQIKMVTSQSKNQHSINIPIADLSTGMYIVQLSNGKEHQNLKFIKTDHQF